ncbi:hypothetical protein LshimejAT787_1302450 [Lyophyllum shimeji]|uniref:F-box domain-containing protein n=1 Tax=Lyophyllum shimeji TaxID=47721 RepID=A0A9P3UPZ6_LYOSH|nr:hypothetical protein LshimejAT787_1302450 [Lyophyllum shimeji]
MPQLWEKLSLYSCPKEPVQKVIERMVCAGWLWFNCVKAHPFLFEMDWGHGGGFGNVQMCAALRTLIFPFQLPGLRRYSLNIVGEDKLDACFYVPKNSLQNLRIVALSVLRSNAIKRQRVRYPRFENAPRLRMLELCLPFDRYHDLKNLHFPWNQLTHLVILDGLSLYGWRDIIRACPSLKRCYVVFEENAEPEGLDQDDSVDAKNQVLNPPKLEKLVDLTIACHRAIKSDTILDLQCPRLQELTLFSQHRYGGFSPTDQPSSFYRRTAPHLQVLALRQQAIPAFDVLRILRMMPHLVELEIDCPGNYDPILRELICLTPERKPVATPVLAPRLRTLRLVAVNHQGMPSKSTFSAAPLIQAVQSRWWAGADFDASEAPAIAYLDHVTIVHDANHAPVVDHVTRELQRLVQWGLELVTVLQKTAQHWPHMTKVNLALPRHGDEQFEEWRREVLRRGE